MDLYKEFYNGDGYDCKTCSRSLDTSHGLCVHHSKTHGESLQYIDVDCDNCENIISKKRSRVRSSSNIFCDDDCKWEYKRTSVECSNCGNDLTVAKSIGNSLNNHFCDDDCKSEYWYIDIECELCGDMRTISRSSYENNDLHFCSRSCKDGYFSGENHWNWKGGSAGDKQRLIRWGKKVKERDGNICQECGSDKNISAHHILPKSDYPDRMYDMDNGISLCVECHAAEHEEMGQENIAGLIRNTDNVVNNSRPYINNP